MVINIALSVKRLQSDIFEINETCPSPANVFLSEKLSHAFTLHHSIEAFDMSRSDRLTVHVVGATHEYNQFDRYSTHGANRSYIDVRIY